MNGFLVTNPFDPKQKPAPVTAAAMGFARILRSAYLCIFMHTIAYLQIVLYNGIPEE